jgi:hypothetical protein
MYKTTDIIFATLIPSPLTPPPSPNKIGDARDAYSKVRFRVRVRVVFKTSVRVSVAARVRDRVRVRVSIGVRIKVRVRVKRLDYKKSCIIRKESHPES